MTGRYQKVEGKRLSKLLLDTARQAVRVLGRDPETAAWVCGLGFEDLHLGAPFLDEETSRHLSDDRDVYFIEGTSDGMPAMFQVDFVHEEQGDRRGHCVSFDLCCKGHHLEGCVVLPLPGDDDLCGRPFVVLERITNY